MLLYLLIIVLGTILLIFGLWRRCKSEPKQLIDRLHVMTLLLHAFGFAAALAGGIFPAIWLVVSSNLNGGPIEQNLPPGYDGKDITALLIFGAAFTCIDTFFNYRDQLTK